MISDSNLIFEELHILQVPNHPMLMIVLLTNEHQEIDEHLKLTHTRMK